jgi:hypothetical protein
LLRNAGCASVFSAWLIYMTQFLKFTHFSRLSCLAQVKLEFGSGNKQH